MNIITCDRVLRVTDSAIDSARNQMSGHNEQVAYVTYKLMTAMEDKDGDFIHWICRTAYFHDIGCYKTNDKSYITNLEAVDPHAHAAYGYVFLKAFFADGVDLSAIKYHHLPWNRREYAAETVSEYAFLIHLADRIAIAASTGADVVSYVDAHSGTLFSPEHVALFHKANQGNSMVNYMKNGYYCIELRAFLSRFTLCSDDVVGLAKMMCYAMDFGSIVTVNHSILVTEITRKLAQLYHLPDDTVEEMAQAASLHDIGKLVVPISIIEKPGKLTADEYKMMQYHAVAGYDILSSIGLENLRDIASLHHEKLDGSGYPFGLNADQLSFPVRLVTVADILSALMGKRSYKDELDKDSICSILQKMADNNEIDGGIVSTVLNHYDEIISHSKVGAEPIMKIYTDLNEEFELVLLELLALMKR